MASPVELDSSDEETEDIDELDLMAKKNENPIILYMSNGKSGLRDKINKEIKKYNIFDFLKLLNMGNIHDEYEK